jgi:hypothetical protein
MTLPALREELSKIEEDLDEMCQKHGFNLTYFYKNPKSVPKQFLNESLLILDALHKVLSNILQLKHGRSNNLSFLSDYR